ncbi:MAG: hypothetical protein HN514_05915 [Candidatus Marinimicrobia bacterium]|jgi:hypothetical protein|nr:hypothetical protein [Candidatus Neomarinimicrobiota bacterium]
MLKNEKDRKYIYGIFKRFRKKYPKLTFTEFEKEIYRDDYDEKKFYQRLQFGDFGDWI